MSGPSKRNNEPRNVMNICTAW